MTSALVVVIQCASCQALAEDPDFGKRYDEIAAKIPSAHPRLFLTPGSVEKIKADAAADPLLKLYVANLRKQVEAYPADVSEETCAGMKAWYSRHDKWGQPAARAALAYVLTGDRKYLQKGLDILTFAADWYSRRYADGKAVSWYGFSRIGALCAYDWLYNDMTPAQRQSIGAQLLKHVTQAQDVAWIRAHIKAMDEGTSSTRSGFYGAPVTAWYAGLVFWRDGVDDAAAEKLLRKGLDDHLSMLRYRTGMAGDDGGSITGCVAYVTSAYFLVEYNFFDSWEALTGSSIVPAYRELGLLPNWILWATILGTDGTLYEYGTGSGWHTENKLRVNPLYLARFRSFYQDVSESTCRQVDFFISHMDKFKDDYGPYGLCLGRWDHRFCYYPFSFNLPTRAALAKQPPELPKLPRARHFEKLGQTFMNSGWQPDSTYCLFTCGAQSPSHKHYDENNFIIYKGGFLALDTGSRTATGIDGWLLDLPHDRNYYPRSIAHNVVLIHMPEEKWEVTYPSKMFAEANDGGMRQSTGGVVRAFETNDFYSYVAGDSVRAYHPDKAERVLRQFVFVAPDFFVIYDTVVSKEADQKKTWLLHSQNEPNVTGSVVSFDEGQGRLFCRSFLPQDHVIERIGGPGREFWVDGRNWPLGPNRLATVAKRGKPTLWGNWRVELSARARGRDVRFLNLIQVGMVAQLGSMAPAEYVRRGDREGLWFESQGVRYTVLFDTAADPGGSFRAEKGGRAVYAKELTRKVQDQRGLGN